MFNLLNNVLWLRPYQSLADKGDRIAWLCIREGSQNKTIAHVNFWMYLTFIVALGAYVPFEYPGWLTWVLYLREWLGKGSESRYMGFTVLFFFHVIPYTIISLSLGYVSIVPGCQLLKIDPHGHAMMELGVSRKEILKSLVRITFRLIVRYYFLLMTLGFVMRLVFVSARLSTAETSLGSYGMNPFLGMVADFVCLGLMIFGKIFSSFYCSMKYPQYFPAFLLSIWMTIEYWILYSIILFLNSRILMRGIYDANPNDVLYISWVITGIIGTTIAWYTMAKPSVFKKFKDLL